MLNYINFAGGLKKFQHESYLHSLDLLRGLAACAVMLYHFTIYTTITLPEDNYLKKIGAHGGWGVEVFFLISGLVIPYSLYRSNFSSIKDFALFIKKRIIRIDIPYVATILLEILLILLATLTPWAGKAQERLDIWNLLLHLGYLNAFVGADWLLPVFWTLAIEFQFYIFIALIFPFLDKSKLLLYFFLFSFIVLSLLFSNQALVFTHLIFFAFGLAIFYFKVSKTSASELLAMLILLAIILTIKYNFQLSLLLVFTTLLILYLNKIPVFFTYLGKISFSIYLLHIPIGGRILVIAEKLHLSESFKMHAIVLAILCTLVASFLFYIYIERPSFDLAKSISRSSQPNLKEEVV